MSAVIMLFILTLILFVQRGGWAAQSHRVDIRVSPTAERLIRQQIHGNAVFVALRWWGQTNIVELQRWQFLSYALNAPYIHTGGPRAQALTVTADVYRLRWFTLSAAEVLCCPTCPCGELKWWDTLYSRLGPFGHPSVNKPELSIVFSVSVIQHVCLFAQSECI